MADAEVDTTRVVLQGSIACWEEFSYATSCPSGFCASYIGGTNLTFLLLLALASYGTIFVGFGFFSLPLNCKFSYL